MKMLKNIGLTILFSFLASISVNAQLDPALFESLNMTEPAQLVNCQLENGQNTQCYQLKFKSNPVPDDGPYCPETVSDTGGFGVYDGATNPGFQLMVQTLWNAMENDGYDIVDNSGNVRIQDPGGGGPPPNPSFAFCLDAAADDFLELTFLIPANPVNLTTPNTITNVELVGVSLDGAPMNGDPPSVTTGQMGNGNIPALDHCGGHHDPAGYYHMHFIPENMNEVLGNVGINSVSCTDMAQSNSALSGFAKDGYPIYSSHDDNGQLPNDLDQCNGHTSATPEYPSGVYHYHASPDQTPNMPPCLMGASANNNFSLSVYIPTEVEELAQKSNLNVYPNPTAQGYFIVETNEDNIQLHDGLGRRIWLPPHSICKTAKGLKIDVAPLRNGVYFIKAGDKYEKVMITNW